MTCFSQAPRGAAVLLAVYLPFSPRALAHPPVRGEARSPGAGHRRLAAVRGRLRPLRQNLVARAYVRAERPSRRVRRALRLDLERREAPFGPAWTPEPPSRRQQGPLPSSALPGRPVVRGRDAEARSTLHRTRGSRPALRRLSRWGVLPPSGRAPLLRRGVGYPLPPWLRGIRLPDIPIRFSSQVYRWLAYYRTSAVGRAVLRRRLGRMHRFEGLIRAELRRHGLPESLMFVALIESGFRLRVLSRAGAAGLWQFMPQGGRIYGLRRDFWVDERYNPDRATRAVMYYFKDLYYRFGNWELALAAYNAGYGAVMRAVRQFNTNDYYRLCELEGGLPYETVRYVPKFFAIAVVAANLDRFDLRLGEMAAPWEYALVTVRGGTSVKRVAALAGVPEAAILALNPELRRARVPPGPNFEVRIPPGSLATFRRAAAVASLGHQGLRTYRVRHGESLSSIARDLGVSQSLLRRINQIRRRSEVRPGVVLFVPAGARHRRRRAAKARPLRLVAVPPMSAPESGLRTVYYPVVSGDRLEEIARVLGVSVADLLVWNNINPLARLLPGMVLRAWVPRDRKLPGVRLLDPKDLEVVRVNSRRFHERRLGKRRRVVVRARAGDTLRRLARRYGVSAGSVARANLRSRGHRLRPGEPVVLYLRRSGRLGRHRTRRSPRRSRRHSRRSHR